MTSRTVRASTNYSLSVASSSSNGFAPASFGGSASGAALAGGAGASAGSVYSASLTYAPDGNVLSATDSANGNWTYSYDDFNRLTGSNKNGGQQTYNCVYDRFGNRWQQNAPLGGNQFQSTFMAGNNRMDGYSYDAAGNMTTDNLGHTYIYDAENRIVSISGGAVTNQLPGYGYDAAGNMTSDPTDNVSSTYDAENRIATASTPQGVFTYTYDADGNRVEKSGGSTSTIYWYMTPGIIGESDLSGTMKSEYVFFNGERVARRDNPSSPSATVAYYFSDHLKTASIVTDSAGNIKAESDYYPWGGELQFVNNDSNHFKFTGKGCQAPTAASFAGITGAFSYNNRLQPVDMSANSPSQTGPVKSNQDLRAKIKKPRSNLQIAN